MEHIPGISNNRSLLILWITTLIAAVAWSSIFLVALNWELRSECARFNGVMHQKAEMIYQNALSTLRWIGGHGGVYVEVGEGVAPNSLLVGLPERDIRTPSNRLLTLFNSPTLLRHIFEEFETRSGTRIRLTGRNPINPNNRPNEWEEAGLRALDAGAESFARLDDLESRDSFRFMRPVLLKDQCLECHDSYEEQDVGKLVGAVSVDLDITKEQKAHDDTTFSLMTTHLVFWGVGLLGIAGGAFRWRKMLTKLENMASHDPLTGLLNRRTLMPLLEGEIARALRYGQNLTVMMLDIDHFKNVNDTYGHLAGDDVLRCISALLREHMRISDILSRYGGEELLIVCPNTDRATAVEIAERIRKAVAGSAIDTIRGKVPVTVSIGIAGAPRKKTVDDLVGAADKALYVAKGTGRNRVCAAE